MIVGSNDLYELAGLDHERWSILGIDLVAFSHGEPSDWDVRVYALDNQEHGVGSRDDLLSLEASRGSLPVVEVLLANVSLEDVVRAMKVVHFFQLLSRDWKTLDIVSRTNHPQPS